MFDAFTQSANKNSVVETAPYADFVD